MKYKQIPQDTFQRLVMNAGILVDDFDPSTGEIDNILGATTGGIQFHDSVTYIDKGEDIDNCPKNTKELKEVDEHEVRMSGTFLTADNASVKMLMAAADIDGTDTTKIVPRDYLKQSDFTELWWIGDYSDVNTGDDAGFLAIHLMNALNTNGFQIQSTDNNKATMAFDFLGHYSIDAQDVVPYEVFIAEGTAAEGATGATGATGA